MYEISLLNKNKNSWGFEYTAIQTIHDNDYSAISSGSIVEGINAIDSFTFSLNANGLLGVNDYKTEVEIYDKVRNTYKFFGRVLYSSAEMSDNGTLKGDVICESCLGFLCDSEQENEAARTWNASELFEYLVNKHNAQVEPRKRFTIGDVNVQGSAVCEIPRKNTWETIKETLIGNFGGEIRYRYERRSTGQYIYIDYLTEIGETSTTAIEVSQNMKSVSRERDPSEIVTRLIPLGAKINDTEERLDIRSVNGGKNYIDDVQAQNAYGIRVKSVEFDDITVPENLLIKGQEYLAEKNKIRVKYTVTALDLSLLGYKVDDFAVCNYYPIKNHLLGIDDTARIIKKTTDVCDETKSSFEIGEKFETMSDIQVEWSKWKKESVTKEYVDAGDYSAREETIEIVEEKIEEKDEENREYTSQLVEETDNANRSDTEALVEEERERAQSVELVLQRNQDSLIAKIESAENAISYLEIDLDGIRAGVENNEGAISRLQIAVNEISASVGNGVTSAELALTIGNDGVARISANADEIELTGDKVSITSTYFTLLKNGGLTAKYATLEECKVTSVASGSTVTIDRGYISIKNGGAFLNIGAATTSMGQTRGYIRGGTATGNGIYFFEDGLYLNGNAYANAPIATTSDANKKNSITALTEKYSALFDNLTPRLYKYNDGTSNRVHVGFIAQEVEAAVTAAGLTSLDFAGFVKSDEQEIYMLRYEEFVALCVQEIQSLKKKVEDLENGR